MALALQRLLVVLPSYWSSVMFLETLLECGAEGLQHTRSITISMRNDELGVPSESYDHDDDILDLSYDEDWEDWGSFLYKLFQKSQDFEYPQFTNPESTF